MTDRVLYERACEALKRAYVPYSEFPVGACLLSVDGRTFDGCNIENASYGATVCAERVALYKAISEGERDFTAVAVTSSLPDRAFPCGICRQVLSEFAPDIAVVLPGKDGVYVTALAELLPHAFKL